MREMLFFAISCALAGAASGQNLTTEYGINLITVGAPGNRDTTYKEAPGLEFMPSGGVDYEYRIGQTELTNTQWLEFVNAYAPYWAADGNDPGAIEFTGVWIFYTPPAGQPPSAPGGTYAIWRQGAEQWPTKMASRLAARYCNWLHNDKALTPEAFNSGAYDASTFTQNPDGSFNDQVEHSPGARFWIPTADEYIKAMHYDPDRYGPGLDGYWLYPDSSNELIPGFPEDGGETSAGIIGLPGFPVAQYPNVQSPWGLLDGSGGESNWTETVSHGRARYFFGSWTGAVGYPLVDRLDMPAWAPPLSPSAGFRIAALVPTPSGVVVVVIGMAYNSRRKRSE